MEDLFNLQRFLEQQNPEYPDIVEELRSGHKSGHWIWYVFPQMKGLGSSHSSQYYGISSQAEAETYLKHPVLGARLIECTNLVLAVEDRTAAAILGQLDAMKFRSSMTLFAQAANGPSVFAQALEKYFAGQPCPLTLQLLSA